MKICLFHPRFLPPKDYGGVERVVLWLAQGLIERGHEVWVGALRGSRVPRGAHLLEFDESACSAWEMIQALPRGMEIVHFMAPPESGSLERLPCPAILTVHGNGKLGEQFPRNTVFLSQDHAARHGAREFVYNGLDPDEYQFVSSEKKSSRLLFLSKTSWSVKNVKGAARICKRAGVDLDIAGGNRPLGLRFMSTFRADLRWQGAVAGVKKAQLLAEARALIFPVTWPEPFGLVVAEALLSGTPVLASRIGSLPELLPPEVGVLFPVPQDELSEEKWVEWLRSSSRQFSAERCREWAMANFHFRRMAECYEKMYRRVTAGESLNPTIPVASDWKMLAASKKGISA